MSIQYRHDDIATFDVDTETLFRYMSQGGHQHTAFKSHRLVGVTDNLVTLEAEVFNPDGSTFSTTIEHRLTPPHGIETTMIGGPFDGARFTHSYTPIGDKTKVDLAGEFPDMPGMSEAAELEIIDGFFSQIFAEDTETLKNWS